MMMTKALTEKASLLPILPIPNLAVILARFLSSSEFVWAVANTKVILKITVKSLIINISYEKWPKMPSPPNPQPTLRVTLNRS